MTVESVLSVESLVFQVTGYTLQVTSYMYQVNSTQIFTSFSKSFNLYLSVLIRVQKGR